MNCPKFTNHEHVLNADSHGLYVGYGEGKWAMKGDTFSEFSD